jgi:organic hydroperoxide reductase OsmC/OhrA
VGQTRAKRLEFRVALERSGCVTAEGAPLIELPREWTAEHLVLAGLCRCSLASLAYHVRRAGGDSIGRAQARGVVTRRESDGRYAFVRVECDLDVEIEPEPPDVRALLAKAERDCFVSASLTTKTHYRWRVNGADAG